MPLISTPEIESYIEEIQQLSKTLAGTTDENEKSYLTEQLKFLQVQLEAAELKHRQVAQNIVDYSTN